MIPSNRKIREEKRKLRAFIEDKTNNLLDQRLAQLAEDTLRWATEDTDGWKDPVHDVVEFARIIRGEGGACAL